MPKKRKKRRSTQRKTQDYPGWAWMLFGLAIGLSVAFAIFVRERQADGPGPESGPATAGRQPASLESALDVNGETKSAARTNTRGNTHSDTHPEKPRFDFYEMLPNFEVVIPIEDVAAEADVEPQAIVEPGLYLLQAGSFTTYEAADRRRAELALQGIESRIHRVNLENGLAHRVYIGPIDDLDELNMTRSRLRAAKIDVLRRRVGD